MRRAAVAGGLLLGCGAATYTAAQSGNTALPAGAEWRSYAADLFSTKYSPLDQINAGNVSRLRIAWRWKSNNFGPRNEGNMETTPLMIGGRLYFTAGQRRAVIAADAADTSVTDLVDHDLRFHALIAAGSGNPVLADC